jgi:hypothetical protein
MDVSAFNPEVYLATLLRPATFVKRGFGSISQHDWSALQKRLAPPHYAALSLVSSLAKLANRCDTVGV